MLAQDLKFDKSDNNPEIHQYPDSLQSSKRIFQISKEELKSDAPLAQVCDPHKTDIIMHDDYEKFINEGDQLVLDDL
jgi:hypothetical protein